MAKYLAALAVAIVVIGGLFMTGCGGDESASVSQPGSDGSSANGNSSNGDSTSDAAKPLTKRQFIKKANNICRTMVTDTTYEALPIREQEEAKPDFDRVAVDTRLVSDILIPALRDTTEELEELDAPPADEERIEAIMDATQTAIDEMEEDPEGFAKEANPVFTEAEKLAEAYGLSACPYG